MSDLTITHAGISVTPNSPGSSVSTGKRAVIRINPTISTSAYGASQAVFNSTEIPNAVRGEGGCSKLISVSWRVETSSGVNGGDMNLIFSQKLQANLCDSLSENVDITIDEVKDSNFLGFIHIDNSDNYDILNGTNVGTIGYSSLTSTSGTNGVFLQAEAGSTSAYVSGINGGGTWTAQATDGLELIFNIEY